MPEKAGRPNSAEAMLAAAKASIREGKSTASTPGSRTPWGDELAINPSWYRSENSSAEKPARQDTIRRQPVKVQDQLSTPPTPERPISMLSLVPRPNTQESRQFMAELRRAEAVVAQAKHARREPELLTHDYSPEVVEFMRNHDKYAPYLADKLEADRPSTLSSYTKRVESLPYPQASRLESLTGAQIHEMMLRARKLAVRALAIAVVTYPAGYWAGDMVRRDESWVSIAPRMAATSADAVIKSTLVVRDIATLAETPLKAYFNRDDDTTEGGEPETER